MKKILIILSLFLIILAGCTQQQSSEEQLLILTSNFPLYEFTREIAPQENVQMLIPPGTDVHHYDLKPSDLIKLERADLIIFIGEEMEPWLDRVLEIEGKHKEKTIQATKKVQLIKAENEQEDEHSEEFEQFLEKLDYILHEWEDGDMNLEEALNEIEELLLEYELEQKLKDDYNEEFEHFLEEIYYIINELREDNINSEETLHEIEELLHQYIEHSHESEYDPHIWLDFENNIEIINAITTKLSELKPEQSSEYRKNADLYIVELRQLNRNYEEELENCEIREFITNHDSFRYLAQKYNLKQIPIRGLSAEQEPSPRTIASIIEEAKENDIKHVFFEELASPRVSEALAKEIEAETLMLSPAENIPAKDWGKKTFIDLMKENLENLKTGLRCD